MKNTQSFFLHLAVSIILVSTHASALAHTAPKDTYTSLITRPLADKANPVLGTDGKYHIAYEIIIENASTNLQASLQNVEVLPREGPTKTFASLSGATLRNHLFTLAARPAETLNIAVSEGRILAINLRFDSANDIPQALIHRVSAHAADNPGAQKPVGVVLAIGRIPVTKPETPVLAPPVKGKDWVAINGCCKLGFPHRTSILPINGELVLSQRFAIDWMRLNDKGTLVDGPVEDVKSWAGYGAELLAVADGTVVHAINDLDDQIPGKLPDPKSLTLETVEGNSIVLDIGNGFYVSYAHMIPGSLKVAKGDKVKRGDVIGLLGNSGNTSAPHLHIQVMSGPSPLADNGVPYVIDRFEYAGQVDRKSFMESETLTENFGTGRISSPKALQNAYPLQLDIIDFPN